MKNKEQKKASGKRKFNWKLHRQQRQEVERQERLKARKKLISKKRAAPVNDYETNTFRRDEALAEDFENNVGTFDRSGQED